jgi:polygalacturonase
VSWVSHPPSFVLLVHFYKKIYNMRFSQILAAVATTVLILAADCSAQLSGRVGPTTSTASKAAKKICNVLNFGAKADQSTDLGPALLAAFTACKAGGIGLYFEPVGTLSN